MTSTISTDYDPRKAASNLGDDRTSSNGGATGLILASHSGDESPVVADSYASETASQEATTSLGSLGVFGQSH